MHLMQNHRDRVTCSSPSRGERSLQAILPRKWNPCFTQQDRKSTRLNSSHGYISYAVFCLKKKKKQCRRIVLESRDDYGCCPSGACALTRSRAGRLFFCYLSKPYITFNVHISRSELCISSRVSRQNICRYADVLLTL